MGLQMSSNETAIQVENLSKCYHIYNRPQDRLKQSIIPRLQMLVGRPASIYFSEFWALRDVSFDVKKGETIGIIGRNGSGKSTLLQLICGTLTPTNGTVNTSGRIAALLELGSGFNPEFTGRENVYLNGAILGLDKNVIDARFDDIAAFADIGAFIDQPVKMYSSGMYIRLAFAINIMSQPDIMIVDEALAVGDMKFQAKCMTALKRRQEAGTTVLFVSHDIGAVKSLCSRGVYLEHGEVKKIGPAAEVATYYIRIMHEEINSDQGRSSPAPLSYSKKNGINGTELKSFQELIREHSEEFSRRVAQFRYGSGEARVIYVELLNMTDEPISLVEFNQKVKIRIYFAAYKPIKLSVNFAIMDDKKYPITSGSFNILEQPLLDVRPGDIYQVDYSVQLPLQEGSYSIRIGLTEPVLDGQSGVFVDAIDDAVIFSVPLQEKTRFWSKVYLFPSVEIKAISREKIQPDIVNTEHE
jgi:lipopolysaccharide transport system ATP-binding protein